MKATGPFGVKLTPLTPDGTYEDTMLGRLTIDKQYHGDLEGTGRGQMLTGGTAVKGSAGYVAMERVTGTLHGKGGSFILQHIGTMAGGNFNLSITVVPDSGTDELVGLSGSMNIIIVEKKHSYEFDYTISRKSEPRPRLTKGLRPAKKR
jgi:Protein of unknown function (DUF3224)